MLEGIYSILLADKMYVGLLGNYSLQDAINFETVRAAVFNGKLLIGIFLLLFSYVLVNVVVGPLIGLLIERITKPKLITTDTKRNFLKSFNKLGFIKRIDHSNIAELEKRAELFEIADDFTKKEAIPKVQHLMDAYLKNIIIPYSLFCIFYFSFFSIKLNSSLLSWIISTVGIILLLSHFLFNITLQAFCQTAPAVKRLMAMEEMTSKRNRLNSNQ